VILPKLCWVSIDRNSNIFTHVGRGYIEVGFNNYVDYV
jgi:hypothetical protein